MNRADTGCPDEPTNLSAFLILAGNMETSDEKQVTG